MPDTVGQRIQEAIEAKMRGSGIMDRHGYTHIIRPIVWEGRKGGVVVREYPPPPTESVDDE